MLHSIQSQTNLWLHMLLNYRLQPQVPTQQGKGLIGIFNPKWKFRYQGNIMQRHPYQNITVRGLPLPKLLATTDITMYCRDCSKKVVGDDGDHWCTKFIIEVSGPRNKTLLPVALWSWILNSSRPAHGGEVKKVWDIFVVLTVYYATYYEAHNTRQHQSEGLHLNQSWVQRLTSR